MRVGLGALALLVTVVAVSAVAVAAPPNRRDDLGRSSFLRASERAVAQARSHWWDPKRGWYDERLDHSWQPNRPLARLWTAYPLFEALDAIAIADPLTAHRQAVRTFAAKAEDYFNPSVRPIGGYAYYIGTRLATADTFYDDNGWWGIAFVDAYRATGDRRYLRNAQRAFDFIVGSGWDRVGGGIWWDTRHRHKTSEPLAAAAYVGLAIYAATGNTADLRVAKRLIAWANRYTWNRALGLYGRNRTDATVMDYVEGMMIGAQLELCALPAGSSHCALAEQLARRSVSQFSVEWEPGADAIYLRFLLDLYKHDGNCRWYDVVERAARRIVVNARRDGLFLNHWDGTFARGNLLRFHAATASVLGWLGATSSRC